ncbi:MAG: NYN domain-containing protein [Thermodesulfobacteriota bacterium]
MPYLVDGNNVMALTPGWFSDRGRARRRLIFQLVSFVAVHRTKVTVVFDGASDVDFPEGTLFKGVRIRYARHGSDADHRIKELVRGASFKRDIVVVTSDSDLKSFAGREGSRVLGARAFHRMLTADASDKEIKPGPDHEEVDVEEWLDFFKTRGS